MAAQSRSTSKADNEVPIGMTPEELQSAVMNFADSLMATVSQASNLLVTFKSVYMVSNLIKSRSLSMVRVPQQKPGERDRDGTRNTYNTSV
jgi:hypothetical protein